MEGKGTPIVLITGGTGGIGLQSAIGIARTGAKVLITGRNKDRGTEVRGPWFFHTWTVVDRIFV